MPGASTVQEEAILYEVLFSSISQSRPWSESNTWPPALDGSRDVDRWPRIEQSSSHTGHIAADGAHTTMRFAVPCIDHKVAPKMSDASAILLLDANPRSKNIMSIQELATPAKPQNLVDWMADIGTDVVLAVDVESNQRALLASRGVQIGETLCKTDPEKMVMEYLSDA